MIRKQIVIEESQDKVATELARARGISVSELIRELIDREASRAKNDQMRRAAESMREEYLNNPDLQDFSLIEVEGLGDEG